jgi:hypothetical protein
MIAVEGQILGGIAGLGSKHHRFPASLKVEVIVYV